MVFSGEELAAAKQPLQQQPSKEVARPQSGDQMDSGFNIDDIIHMDVIPGKLEPLV